MVNILDPDDAEIIFSSSKNIDKAAFYKFFKIWLGEGLLTSSGQKWHERRKMLTPAFHFSILETFLETFIKNSALMMEKLKKKVGSVGFDIFPYMSDCALDIICESAMGVEVNIQKGASRDYLLNVKEVTQLLTDRLLRPWFHISWIYKRTEHNKKLIKALQVLHGTSMRVIEQRKQERKDAKENENKTVKKDDTLIGTKQKKAFLDLLLDIAETSENKLTVRDIREEVDTFMFEGHDTTSAALSWTIHLVGRDPEVQEKIHEELDSVFGSLHHIPTMKDMAALKYLECVIKESLRLFPSVPFIGRTLVQDVKIGGYEIPAGTSMMIHVYLLHRQSNYYPEPSKFNPDNFLSENTRKKHPFSYVPFSAGPRNCIGQKFAMLEMKVVLSTFFRQYKVESLQKIEDLTIIPDSILRPSGDGIQIKITKRNESRS